MVAKDKLPEVKVESLGKEETFTKIVFTDDRPACIAKMKARRTHWVKGERVTDDLCGKKAEVMLDKQPFCENHAGDRRDTPITSSSICSYSP